MVLSLDAISTFLSSALASSGSIPATPRSNSPTRALISSSSSARMASASSRSATNSRIFSPSPRSLASSSCHAARSDAPSAAIGDSSTRPLLSDLSKMPLEGVPKLSRRCPEDALNCSTSARSCNTLATSASRSPTDSTSPSPASGASPPSAEAAVAAARASRDASSSCEEFLSCEFACASCASSKELVSFKAWFSSKSVRRTSSASLRSSDTCSSLAASVLSFALSRALSRLAARVTTPCSTCTMAGSVFAKSVRVATSRRIFCSFCSTAMRLAIPSRWAGSTPAPLESPPAPATRSSSCTSRVSTCPSSNPTFKSSEEASVQMESTATGSSMGLAAFARCSCACPMNSSNSAMILSSPACFTLLS
mmetsp:Transcript_6382/g.16641  ORF Transcript_6382/g.16641 Transcript_6382/m.16641 type:complete len:367 (-) Transcript_6382:1945-3045(-)